MFFLLLLSDFEFISSCFRTSSLQANPALCNGWDWCCTGYIPASSMIISQHPPPPPLNCFIFFFFCSSFTYQSIWFADFKNVSIVGHYVKDRTKDAQFIIIRYFLLKMIRYSRSIINADYFLSHEWWVPPWI